MRRAMLVLCFLAVGSPATAEFPALYHTERGFYGTESFFWTLTSDIFLRSIRLEDPRMTGCVGLNDVECHWGRLEFRVSVFYWDAISASRGARLGFTGIHMMEGWPFFDDPHMEVNQVLPAGSTYEMEVETMCCDNSRGHFLIHTTYDVIHTVPEPMSLILLGTGLVGIGLMARRRRQRGEE